MLAFFNLGLPELIFLTLLAILQVGGTAVIIGVVIYSTRRRRRGSPEDD